MGLSKVVRSILFALVALVYLAVADEAYIQVNLRRPVNVVSDKYVSFSIDPQVLLDNINSTDSGISDFMAKQLKPSYLKISGNSFFDLLSALSNNEPIQELKDNIPHTVWMKFNRWIRSVDWLPIVPLPYNPKKWDSIHALRILNISHSLGVRDCIWQLGIDFDPTDAPRYVDDLTTLKNVADAFDDVPNHWGVIGADISAGSNRDETRLYVDLAQDVVEAIGWIQPAEYSTYENQNQIVDDRDMALRAILSRQFPVWLTVPPKMLKHSKNARNCSALCITEGLQWAQILGDAARTGFNVVFKPLDKSDIIEPGFSFYISWLFKKTMGEEVFDSRMLSGDRYVSHFYAHCTKDLSGALTIMGVNMGDMPSRILTKLSYRYSGSELWQYILTVSDGAVKLNGQTIRLNSTFEPLVKIKHPSKPMTLVLPPLSIGFFILPSANLRECLREDIPEKRMRSYFDEDDRTERLMTSSDRLLQQLIKENIASNNKPVSNRLKRHIVVKKDSNYLNQLTKDLDKFVSNQYSKPAELVRHKRFILQNNNRPRLFQNLFDLAGLGGANALGGGLGGPVIAGPVVAAPAPPPPSPPPPPPKPTPVETPLDDTRRFKRVFPKLPFMKLEQFFHNRRAGRVRRQAPNFFKLAPFTGPMKENKPTLFPGFRRMIGPNSPAVIEKPQVNEEKLLAVRPGISFPQGDVHVNITKIPDADYDYVEFDTADKAPKKTKKVMTSAELKSMPNAYAISDIIPRVDKPFVPSNSRPDMEPMDHIDDPRLRHAREQLETYYLTDSKQHTAADTLLHPKPKGILEDSNEESTSPVNTRKRRNAVLKSISWALDQGDQHLSNLIHRENLENDNSAPVYNRMLPYLRLQDYERSAKPRSLEELQAESAQELDNLVDNQVYGGTTPSDIDLDHEHGQDVAKIRIIAEAPANNPQAPKFMKYLTAKLNNFMDMVNDHVTGWWNTWV